MGILDFLFRRSRPVQTTAPTVVDHFAARRERRDLRWRQLLENVEQPYELVPGAQAETKFEAARVLGQTQKFCPLIIQPGFDAPIRSDPISLKNSNVRTPEEYFGWRAHGLVADTDWNGLALFEEVKEVEPTAAQGLYMTDMLSPTRPVSLLAEVAILRLPCTESWKIPLFVPIGERTCGEEIGIQKQWYERFGAELCSVGDRYWQFRVARPPRNDEEAVELLRQHYLYQWVDGAYDKEAIENGAAALRVATHWMFFWE